MAAGGPAGPHLHESGVVGIADVNMAGGNVWSLGLGMAAQAQVGVVIGQHFLVNGTVRVVADSATFA